ncbi:lipid IV(A) 3-deoxy-D-manno-octulosonic acid transferase [Candidatus Thiosymbion oneisti]|uniref:lipid IV(A) 3-deoxy-D-manno-octulosonic acid transferase n=1 Tax=Candidatus Thiosymbion oneisti TaxID=589554 RepID=UPI000AD6DABB|nr:lipid IV(A) 3-deoxy-D-manno-octulosonic acid transferase [Candidatus Thiosymbion oneisti]
MARLYSLLLYLALPFLLLRLAWRSRHAPAYRKRWGERFGLYGQRPLRAHIWIHAVSVGEVQAAEPLIKHFLARYPNAGVMVTTTTPTGSERLRSLFESAVRHVYTPFDLAPIMSRFLDAIGPRLVVVMETEIWPNMLSACERRGIPVVLANARLSAHSAQRYARLGGFTGETLRRFAAIGAQSPADATRFQALGAPAERVRVMGNIKFDVRRSGSLLDQAEVLRRRWGIRRPVWVAASTHEGEEEQVLRAHRKILDRLSGVLLVLVPRHPERFERIAALVERRGFALARRSADDPCGEQVSVFLGDTMGELPAFLAAGDAAFIGGSLVPTGGHNLLEAAAAGVPVAVGPHTFNFARITELMVREGAAIRVTDAHTLAQCMGEWLGDATTRAHVGEQGRRVVRANQGALQRLLDLIDGIYEDDSGTNG